MPALSEAPTEPDWDVLLSYASNDTEWASGIELKLSDSGLNVFSPYAAPGRFWGRSLEAVVSEVFPARCPVATVVLSSAYRSSEPSLRELDVIISAATGNPSALVLPVRIDDSPIPDLIRHLVALDARDLPASEVAPRIAKRLEETRTETGLDSDRLDRSLLPKSRRNPRSSLLGNRTDWATDRIRIAIDLLGEEDRSIIDLFYKDELSSEEIAKRLEISKSSVYLRQHRALSKLFDLIVVER